MKKCGIWMLLFFLLTGCSGAPKELEEALELRSRLLQASACSFTAEITADYGDKLHTFTMECKADQAGDVFFTVTKPDTISGITGNLTGAGGNLTFDDTALHFELLAERQLSPISAPWVFLKTLRGGNITSACREEGFIRISADDSYEENALSLDIWLNENKEPVHGEILYDGRRILSLAVEKVDIL